MRKYAEGFDQMRITHVFDSVIPQLGKGNRKFQISKVAKGARFKDYAACIDWLCYAGIINRYYCLHFPEPPLKGNYEINAYKLYLNKIAARWLATQVASLHAVSF